MNSTLPDSRDAGSIEHRKRDYWCFISFRHVDNKEPGRQWATWLHQALETYEVPSDLVGTKNERDDIIPDRIFPVFRDEEELPADAELSRLIEASLRRSRFLVVLCSPQAAQSRFVTSEILSFKRLGKKDRILAAIIAGEPNASDEPAKGGAEKECFPQPLRFEVDEAGRLTEARTEPIAANFRLPDGTPGWTTPAPYREALKRSGVPEKQIDARVAEYSKQQNLMLLKIIAGVLGVPLGVLTKRDQAYQLEKQKQRARVLRRWLVAIAVIAIIAVASGIFAVAKRREAVANALLALAKQREAEEARRRSNEMLLEAARSDRLVAEKELAGGDARIALAHLARAIRYDPTSTLPAEKAVAALNSWGYAQPAAFRKGQFSPDGRRILTTSSDEAAQVWDAESGKLLATLNGHEQDVKDARFSPDGLRIVTGSNELSVWDAETGKLLASLKGHNSRVESVQFSSDGERILTSQSNMFEGTYSHLWELKSGKLLATIAAGQEYPEFSPNGELIVTKSVPGSDDEKVAIWNGRSGEKLLSLKRPERVEGHAVASVHFSPGGERFVTASSDKIARVWETQTGKLLNTIGDFELGGHTDRLTSARFSPDGKHIVTASMDKTARVWGVDTPAPVAPLEGHVEHIKDASFSPDGQRIVTTGDDGTARIWQAQSGKLLSIHDAQVFHAEFSPDGQRLVTRSVDGIARVWPVEADKLEVTVEHEDNITDAQFSPDGQRVVTASRDGTARIWDTRSGKLVGSCRDHTEGLNTARFSPDGRTILTASEDKTARLWNAASGDLTSTLRLEEKVTAAYFSPDGQRILTTSLPRSRSREIRTAEGKREKVAIPPYATARIWEAPSGKLLATLDEYRGVRSLSFSPDGQRFITSSNYEARMWDAQAGTLLARFECKEKGALDDPRFSPDGQIIVGACGGGSAEVWEAQSGKLLTVLTHEQGVTSAQFRSGGQHIVTTSRPGEVRLWDLKSRVPVTVLRSNGYDPKVAFIAGGQRFLTVAGNIIELWDAEAGKLVATLPKAPRDDKLKAAVSDDSKYMVTISFDGLERAAERTARIRTLLPPNAGTPPDWIPDFLHYMSQRRLNPDGEMELIAPNEWVAMRERLRGIVRDPNAPETPYLRILRRFLDVSSATPAPSPAGTASPTGATSPAAIDSATANPSPTIAR